MCVDAIPAPGSSARVRPSRTDSSLGDTGHRIRVSVHRTRVLLRCTNVPRLRIAIALRHAAVDLRHTADELRRIVVALDCARVAPCRARDSVHRTRVQFHRTRVPVRKDAVPLARPTVAVRRTRRPARCMRGFACRTRFAVDRIRVAPHRTHVEVRCTRLSAHGSGSTGCDFHRSGRSTPLSGYLSRGAIPITAGLADSIPPSWLHTNWHLPTFIRGAELGLSVARPPAHPSRAPARSVATPA